MVSPNDGRILPALHHASGRISPAALLSVPGSCSVPAGLLVMQDEQRQLLTRQYVYSLTAVLVHTETLWPVHTMH